MKKPNLIILTGVDATGKSTIGQMIKDHFNLPLFHLEKVGSELEGDMINHYFMKCINEDMILDRFYMEEVVYAPVYRGYKASYIKEFEKELMEKFNVILIYTMADTEVIKQRFEDRGEDLTSPDDIEELKRRYDEFLCESLIDTRFMINTSKGFDEKQKQFLMEGLERCLN